MAAYRGNFIDNYINSDKADEIRQFLLNNEPVVSISKDSLLFPQNIEKSFSQFMIEYFSQNHDENNITTLLGDVEIEKRAVKNCIQHGKHIKFSYMFPAVIPVLTNGIVLLPPSNKGTHNKKYQIGMIAAPILLENVRHVFVVVIKITLERKVVYDFSWFSKEKLSSYAGDNQTAHDENSSTPHTDESYISPAKLLYLLLNSKLEDLNNPKIAQANNDNNKKQNENYTQYTKMRNNKQLYESIMKDVAKVVKRKLNEEENFNSIKKVGYADLIEFDEESFHETLTTIIERYDVDDRTVRNMVSQIMHWLKNTRIPKY